MRKYRNRIIAGLAIGFVIYASLLLLINTEALVAELQNFPWVLLAPVILLKFGSWFFRFLEWHYFLSVVGARDRLALFDSIVLFISGFSMAVSPGKAAEVLKAVVLKAKTGVLIAAGTSVVIAERVVDGLAVIVLAFIALLLAGDSINLGGFAPLIYLSTGLLAAGLVAVRIRWLAHFFLEQCKRLPVVRRLHAWLVTFYESSYEIFKPRHLLPTTAFGMIAALGDAIGFVVILVGFGLEPTWTLFLQAVVIICLSSAIGALSGVPNGAGITEVSVGTMLIVIVAPQNPALTPAVAAAVALVEGFFHKWFRVLVGLAVGMTFRRRLFSSAVEAEIDALERERRRRVVEYGRSGA
ncbi:MAG: lysylphosphatidylglycerol synthase transmembrane domain-containing protein [Aggregatilineales bacterium]